MEKEKTDRSEKEKLDYSLPEGFPMYDMCHCCADCSAPCARKDAPKERFYSAADFSGVCSKYVKREAE